MPSSPANRFERFPSEPAATDAGAEPLDVDHRGLGLVFFLRGFLTGSLWVANAAPAGATGPTALGTLARFVPRQLATSGYALPGVQLPVAAPTALAFDAAGDLWVIAGGSTLLEFAAGQLDGTSAAPAVTLALDADAAASALAFDALGDLLVTLVHATDSSGALVMFTPGQLALGGTQAPFVALKTAAQMGAASLLLVDPTPAGLPLAGAPK